MRVRGRITHYTGFYADEPSCEKLVVGAVCSHGLFRLRKTHIVEE